MATALLLYITFEDFGICLKDVFFPIQTVDAAIVQLRSRLKEHSIPSEFVLRTSRKFNKRIPQILLPACQMLDYDLTSGVKLA